MDIKSERIILIEDINRHMNEMLDEISSLKAENKHLNEYKETGLKELYEARRERDNYLDDIIGLKEEIKELKKENEESRAEKKEIKHI